MKHVKTNALSVFLVAVNAIAVACHVYAAILYLSHGTAVRNPDAMLPMQDWDRGGLMLLLGAVPMLAANVLGFFCVFKKGTPLPVRLAAFIPGIIALALAAHYIFVTGGLQR